MSEAVTDQQFKVEWIDGKREAKCIPDLRFPDGVDIDASNGKPSCTVNLEHPAPRCGHYYVECLRCGTNALITTAGRIDDPRSVKLPCKNTKP